MKSKNQKIFALIITLVMVGSISLGFVSNAHAVTTDLQPNCVLRLDPAAINGPPPDVGGVFAVSVKIDSVTDLWGYVMGLEWDPAVLAMVYDQNNDPAGAASGGFLTSSLFLASPPNNATGKLPEISEYKLNANNNDGSGTLATVQFKVLAPGNTQINITNPLLKKYTVDTFIIPGAVQNATFSLSPPPAHGPTAKFTTNGATVNFNTTIALDATSSLAGYDTVPSGVVCPITNYAWLVTGAISMNLPNGGSTLSFNASAIGDITIKLTVTAPDANGGGSGPGFTTTSETTKTVTIRAPATAEVDVYTERGGKGINEPVGDVYSPQELIKIYANATWNGAPVAQKDVAFEIKDKFGTTIAYRTNRTDINGLAMAEYRLPWPSEDPDLTFGDWMIIATVDLNQMPCSDTTTFEFNYTIHIVSITMKSTTSTTITEIDRGSSMDVEIIIKNIRSVTVPAVITMTIYDNAGVPVARAKASPSVVPAGGVLVPIPIDDINVDSFAFVGDATIYANAFTKLPSQGGVPYCPEFDANFKIVP